MQFRGIWTPACHEVWWPELLSGAHNNAGSFHTLMSCRHTQVLTAKRTPVSLWHSAGHRQDQSLQSACKVRSMYGSPCYVKLLHILPTSCIGLRMLGDTHMAWKATQTQANASAMREMMHCLASGHTNCAGLCCGGQGCTKTHNLV